MLSITAVGPEKERHEKINQIKPLKTQDNDQIYTAEKKTNDNGIQRLQTTSEYHYNFFNPKIQFQTKYYCQHFTNKRTFFSKL